MLKKRTEIEGEDALVGIIREAAVKSWQAGAWLLERRYPDRWGKRLKTEIAVPPPRADTSEIELTMVEAERTANLTIQCTPWARRGIRFDEWPDELKRASLGDYTPG